MKIGVWVVVYQNPASSRRSEHEPTTFSLELLLLGVESREGIRDVHVSRLWVASEICYGGLVQRSSDPRSDCRQLGQNGDGKRGSRGTIRGQCPGVDISDILASLQQPPV